MTGPGRYDSPPMNVPSRATTETRIVTRSSRAVELWQGFFFFTAYRRRVGA